MATEDKKYKFLKEAVDKAIAGMERLQMATDNGASFLDWATKYVSEEIIKDERLVLVFMHDDAEADQKRLRQVLATVRAHPGPTPCYIGFMSKGESKASDWCAMNMGVDVTISLIRRLSALLESNNVRLQYHA